MRLRYVVQRHAARRLHWDLRLELDGALKSWAVTQQPGMQPGLRRLAVEVEDHPIAYAGFEGEIPPGSYGAGTVEIWDSGSWEPEVGSLAAARAGLVDGRLDFLLHGQRLAGRFHLVRMRRQDPGQTQRHWLLIKGSDDGGGGW
jgi:bifunctional non-homologous end joining protein LigD